MKTNRSTIVAGALLILVGALFLAGQSLGFLHLEASWPLILVGLGLAFFVGMALGGKTTGGLAIPASILCMLGIILFVQDTFDWYETWAYAWGLIIFAVGIGIVIHSYWSDRPDLRNNGWETARNGLALFAVFGAIMEFIFTITGVAHRGSLAFWAGLLIAVGLLQVLFRAIRLLRGGEHVKKDDHDLGGPFFLIGAGCLGVLYSLQWIDGQDLLRLLSLWPLLLIFGGLQIIAGRRHAWLSLLIGLLLLGSMLGAALYGEQIGLRTPSWMTIPSEDWGSGEPINGSGVLAQETRPVAGFDKVRLEAPCVLEIVQGDSESLEVSAEDNLLVHLLTEVQADTLTIRLERGYSYSPTEPMLLKLQVKDLEELRVSTAGEALISGLETDRLNLEASGAGKFTLEDITAEELIIQVSGAGTITASGEVNSLIVEISGASTLDAGDLRAQSARIEISGMGKATLWAVNKLNSSISGAGTVSYYGNPEVDQESSGLGTVNRLGDK